MFLPRSKVRQRCSGVHVFGTFFSLSQPSTISLSILVRRSLPKVNDSELSGGNGGRKSGVYRGRVLIG